MDEREFFIKEEGSLKKYRTEIPNTVIKGSISKKISPYDLALYVHIKSVAGEIGLCYQSTKTLSDKVGMSMGQVSKSKKKLSKLNLISIEKGDYHKGLSDNITINDIWLKNMKEFHTPSSGEKTPSYDEVPSSCRETPPSCDENTPSPHESKKNPNKEEPNKEKPNKEATKKSIIEIFEAYPRKVKKEVALEKIENALMILQKDDEVDDPIEYLLKKTVLFAEAKENTPQKFIPYPENWFSQQRFYEKPEEWNLNSGNKSNEKEGDSDLIFRPNCEFDIQEIKGEQTTNFKARDEILNPEVNGKALEQVQEKMSKKYL